MKIFWSWQSDIPGNIGRHFVRDALAAAIKVLKQPETVEEPSETERREMLHLDHDRKNVPGSPDLAPTILKKIEQSAVFVADVTLVGQLLAELSDQKGANAKRFINSNVGIEYGYALRALGNSYILMVQNLHYGDRDKLPFDLQHKAGPIQYRLAPTATRAEIAAESAKLTGTFISSLRPYLSAGPAPAPAFVETPTERSPAFFFDQQEVFGKIGQPGVDEISLQFTEQRAFYLRLIPALDARFKRGNLAARLQSSLIDTLNQTLGGLPLPNHYGMISCNGPTGRSNKLTSFTQIFLNGELWSVTSAFYAQYNMDPVIPTGAVETVYKRVLGNLVSLAEGTLDLMLPFTVELGGTGVKGMWLGANRRGMIGPVLDEQVVVRQVLNSTSTTAREKVLTAFLDELFDKAGEERAK